MKLAVYHPWVYLKGGCERMLLELMRRSRHEWTLYTNHFEPEATFPGFAGLRVVELPRVSVRRTLRDVAGAGLRILTQRLPLGDAAALMISSEGLGNLTTFRGFPVPVFCYCHTPLKVIYDPFTRHRYFHGRPSLAMRSALRLYTATDRLGWRNYDRVFCNSKEVASRVINAGLAEASRVEVAYPGVDLHWFDPTGPHEPYFLLAGRIARTKTIELAIDAFRQLKGDCPEASGFRLIIAGMVDEKSRGYFEEMRQRAADDEGISFVVDPTDQQLFDLYRRCYTVLFTALNEDWGLVPLEAMASGKTVISVGRGGPLESIVQGQTGFLCEAEPAAFAEIMGQLVRQPELVAIMGRAACAQASRFSWEVFVNRIDEYAEDLVFRTKAAGRMLNAGWYRRLFPAE